MIKPLLFILVLNGAGHWEVGEARDMFSNQDCERAVIELTQQGVKATCSHFDEAAHKRVNVKRTEIIEAQIAVQLAELAVLRKRVDEVTRQGLRGGWCKTVQKNGASPTAPYAFSKVEKYWPGGIKPTVGECIRLIGGTRDPVTLEPPEKIVAQLKRGYQ